jgi:hypothetical protein
MVQEIGISIPPKFKYKCTSMQREMDDINIKARQNGRGKISIEDDYQKK